MQFIYEQYSNFGIILNSKETTESGNNFLASNGEPKKKKKKKLLYHSSFGHPIPTNTLTGLDLSFIFCFFALKCLLSTTLPKIMSNETILSR